MLRGEVWLGVWPNDPHKTPRPVLIVSNNLRNQAPNLLDIIVVKLTSLERKDGSKKPINPSEDVVHTFKKPTIIRCGSIFTIEKSFLKNKLQDLPDTLMSKVDTCLKTALDIF